MSNLPPDIRTIIVYPGVHRGGHPGPIYYVDFSPSLRRWYLSCHERLLTSGKRGPVFTEFGRLLQEYVLTDPDPSATPKETP